MLEIILSFLAAIFGISDLIGKHKSKKLEVFLLNSSRKQFRYSINNISLPFEGRYIIFIIIIACLFSAPFVLSYLFHTNILPLRFGKLWNTIIQIITVFIGVVGAMFSFQILNASLSHLADTLKGKFERKILVESNLFLREEETNYEKRKKEFMEGEKKIYDIVNVPQFPFILAPLVATFLLIFLFVSFFMRLIIGIGIMLIWLFWGVPVIVLNTIATHFDNESYFNVGKYLLLIITFIVVIVSKL